MKKLFSLKLWRALTMALSSILVVLIILNNVATAKASALITVLGGETYRIEKSDTQEDTEYFKRDITSKDVLQN